MRSPIVYNKRYRGLILVFRRYDNLVEEDGTFAESILVIITKESRVWLLTGQKLTGPNQNSLPCRIFQVIISRESQQRNIIIKYFFAVIYSGETFYFVSLSPL